MELERKYFVVSKVPSTIMSCQAGIDADEDTDGGPTIDSHGPV